MCLLEGNPKIFTQARCGGIAPALVRNLDHTCATYSCQARELSRHAAYPGLLVAVLWAGVLGRTSKPHSYHREQNEHRPSPRNRTGNTCICVDCSDRPREVGRPVLRTLNGGRVLRCRALRCSSRAWWCALHEGARVWCVRRAVGGVAK